MSTRTLWLTGAGSGMGRASAVAAARAGWQVALSGRRREVLGEVAAQIEAHGGTALVVPLDVTDPEAVAAAAALIKQELGEVDAVVLSAGLNAKHRAWSDQDLTEFTAITGTNLLGPVAVIDVVLPGMRERRRGTVVLVSSFAGWRTSPSAGVAYSATKTALGPLTEILNLQENHHGIRACHLCPGDVDSDFLEQRPEVPGDADRALMLTAEDVARTVMFVLESPQNVVINELVVTPAKAGQACPS